MASTNNETKNRRPRRTINLCRICLTYSPSLRELSQNLENICEILTIREILEKVMCCEIFLTKDSPNHICPVCLSLLRISYELKNQFEQSQKKLFGNFRLYKNCSVKAETKSTNEVELIVGNNNYNLGDLVIVEDDKKKQEVGNPDYAQILDNLGKTVTVECLSSKTENFRRSLPGDENELSDFQISDISKNFLENEEYETIIIQCESDTEEKPSVQETYVAKTCTSVKSKNSNLLKRKIESLIIEDGAEQCQPNEGTHNKKDDNLNPEIMEVLMRKRRSRKSKMDDVEKFIIYEDDEKEQNLAHNNLDYGSDLNGGELNQCNSQTDASGESGNNTNQAETKFYCRHCSLYFISRWTYKKHFLRVHRVKVGNVPKKPRIEKVPKEIQYKRRILRMKERFLKYPLLCQICGHISKSAGGAKYHSLTHGEKMYKCDLCPKQFYTPSHLKNHFQNKHERNITPHLCPICGENRNSSTALAYHMKLHTTNPRKYKCPICHISFMVKSSLNNHIRRHLGDRRFPCNMCDKAFFSSNERQKHMMTHTGERPHQCKYCDRRFVTPFNMKIHMMTHNGPYSCKICRKGLADEELLKLHVKSKHCASLSDAMESSEYTEADAGERYDKYELLIQSPEKCQENVILEDLSLLDVVEEDCLDFEGD